MPYRPLVISHAACGGHAPENTIAGVRKAIELGADAVEVDVHGCAEGVPVVMHDRTVDRTTDGSGSVRTMSLDELRSLNAASSWPDWPRPEQVPTLAEVVNEAAGRIRLIIEVKAVDIEGAVLEVVRMAHALDNVMIWSVHPQVVSQFRAYQPSIPAALLTGGEEWSDIELFFREALWRGAQACSVPHRTLTPEITRQARLLGLGPYTWTADEEEDLVRAIDCGVAGIVTNYPDRLRRLLDAAEGG